MRPVVHRVCGHGASAVYGRVRLDIRKLAWNGGMLVGAATWAPSTIAIDTVLLFAATTYATLLLGHSVGMHRLLIHRSFDCARWLERSLVYLGVLVGMAGPFGVLRIHDIRDWAQREPECHDFFSHRRSLLLDATWQLSARFEFVQPPQFQIEPKFETDAWYRWLERTWMWQQVPVAVVLYLIGGWPWVVWGVFVRVSVSVCGHWVVTYLTHNPGPGRWFIPSAGVQASNLKGLGLLTMGECWHNNHHAFPESAQIGLAPGETDPGYWVIRTLQRLRLVSRIGQPRDKPLQEDLVACGESAGLLAVFRR